MFTSVLSSPRLFPILIVSAITIIIFSEFHIGKTLTIAFGAGIITILFLLFLLREKNLTFPKTPTMFFAFFIIWSICTTLFSKDLTASMWEDIRLLSLFFLFALTYSVSKIHKPSQLLTAFVLFGSVLILFDFFSYVLSGGLEQNISLIGSFSWHNQMAGFLLLFIPVLTAQIFKEKDRRFRLFYIGVLLLSLISMVLTYSRGGWLILTFQTILFTLFFWKSIKKYALYIIGGIMFLILSLVIINPANITETIASIPRELTENRTVSGSFRIETWQTGLGIIRHFPLVGVGSGAFGSVFASFQDTPWLFARNAHNHLLQVTAETGIFGFILFFCLLLSITIPLFKNAQKTKAEKNTLLKGLIIAIGGSFLHSLIDYDFSTVSLFAIVWFLAGISLAFVPIRSFRFHIKGFNNLVFLYLGIFLLFVMSLETGEDRYQTARLAFGDGYNATALELANDSRNFNPLNGKSYLLMSEIMYAEQEYSHARSLSMQAIYLLPYETKHYTLLGAIATNKKDYEEAINWYKKAIETKPYADPNQYIGLAYSYQQQGNLKQAEIVLNNAISHIFPINQTYKDFEYVYYANGLTNNLARLYIYQANIKQALGKPEEAAKLFETVENELTLPEKTIQIRSPDMLE